MSINPRFPRLFLIPLLLLFIAPRASFAEKPQAWIRLRSRNFIVITNGNEKQARRVAYQFEIIRSVLRVFLNAQDSSPDPPVTIIAAKDEATFKPLLPQAYLEKGATQLAGFYVGGQEKSYICLRLDTLLNQDSPEPFETIYHEYVHYVMRRSISSTPLWLDEGLAEFYGNMRLDGKHVWLGAPSTTNIMVLRNTPLIPVSTLFAVNASSPYYHENDKASIFYAESWVLTHYLLMGDWVHHTEHLKQFLELAGGNRSQEVAASHTIGDPKTLDAALQAYILRFSFTASGIPTPPEVNPESFTLDPLSEAESMAVRADFMVHDGSYSRAKPMLEEALKLDPRLAVTYESMGQLYAQQNQLDEANKWYSQAVALNSQSSMANYYYAANLLKGSLDDDQAAKVEASLRTSIKINPDFAPSHDALAYLLATRHRDLEEARTSALTAVGLEPGNIHYRLRMVQVLEQMGNANDALRVATLTASLAKTPEEWTEAQSALSSAQRFHDYQERRHQSEDGVRSAPAEGPVLVQAEHSEPATQTSGEVQPPVLRHQHETAENSPDQPPPDPPAPAPAERPELLARHDMADGMVSNSACPDSITLELTLASRAGAKHLYSSNYYKIAFSALNFTPTGILNPCSDLKGMHAHITYRPEKAHPEQGEIVSVELTK